MKGSLIDMERQNCTNLEQKGSGQLIEVLRKLLAGTFRQDYYTTMWMSRNNSRDSLELSTTQVLDTIRARHDTKDVLPDYHLIYQAGA